jgi:hypothetical protein
MKSIIFTFLIIFSTFCSTPISAQIFEENRTREILLPSKVDKVVWASCGDVLLLKFNSLEKLAIFDIKTERIIGEIPLPNKDTEILGTADSIFLVLKDKKEIQRWSIQPLVQVLKVSEPNLVEVGGVAGGYASSGPILILTRNGPQIFHPFSLKLIKTKEIEGAEGGRWQGFISLTASADGLTFSGWYPSAASVGIGSLKLDGIKLVPRVNYEALGSMHPSFDGSLYFTDAGVFNTQFKPLKQGDKTITFPTVHPAFYIGISNSKINDKTEIDVSLYDLKKQKLLHTFKNLPGLGNIKNNGKQGYLPFSNRIIAHPTLQKLLVIDELCTRLYILPLDVEKRMIEKGLNYLYVNSLPPTIGTIGKEYVYFVKTISKAGKVKFSIEMGPDGMIISNEGVLRWTVPMSFTEEKVSVVIKMEDPSNTYIYQSFIIYKKEPSNVVNPSEKDPEKSLEKLFDEKSIGEFKLQEVVDKVILAGSGNLILLQMNKLGKVQIFDIRTEKIIGEISLGAIDTIVVGTANSIILISPSKMVIQRWSIEPLIKMVTIPIPFVETIDGAIGGYASNGPFLIMTRQGPRFLDVNKLTLIKTETISGTSNWCNHPTTGLFVLASADGSLFTGWTKSGGPSGIRTLSLEGLKIVEKYLHVSAGPILPNFDGSILFTGYDEYNAELKVRERVNRLKTFPAISSTFYLGAVVTPYSLKDEVSISICSTIGRTILLTLNELPGIGDNLNWVEGLSLSDRIIFNSTLKKLIIIDVNQILLHILQINIEKTLPEKLGDYLFIDSIPLVNASLGKRYVYAIKVFSKIGGIKFSIKNGPPGMTISPEGVLVWELPKSYPTEKVSVKVVVSDTSKKEISHSFIVNIN